MGKDRQGRRFEESGRIIIVDYMPDSTRGTIRASKGYAIFRIIFGLLFVGLGIDVHSRSGANSHAGYITMAIGALFLGYGVVALFSPKVLGSKLEMSTPTATDRLAEITRLKTEGLISDQEYEAKRQEILKDL